MFIKSWVRTVLIWIGLIIFWLINTKVIGYSAPYDVVQGNFVYTYHNVLPLALFLYVLALALVLTGCYIWTQLKSRAWGFMFWGILAPIGLLGISLLKDRTPKIDVLDAPAAPPSQNPAGTG